MPTEQQVPAVAVSNLRKSFGQQTVLDGIDFQVAQGETLAVLGRSGTGKSVLLKLLIGLLPADSGSIRLHGEEIAGLHLKEMNRIRLRIGFVFQQAALYDSLTIGQNVAFPLARHTELSATERDARVRELLARVGMEDAVDKMPSEVSGGMQKRAGLARALALKPDIMLFDEPTSGLDPITAEEINHLIVQLREERHVASVVVTHDIHGAGVISDRMLMIDEGHVVTEGTFAELRRSRDRFVTRFLREAA